LFLNLCVVHLRFSSHLDAAVHSMNAGVDLNSGDNFVLLKNTTRVSSARIDAALTRLLHARMAMGLFDAPNTIAYSSLGQKDIFNAPHKKLALTMSQKVMKFLFLKYTMIENHLRSQSSFLVLVLEI
jgi:beta-glucosidase-like glycosyl hydrolase